LSPGRSPLRFKWLLAVVALVGSLLAAELALQIAAAVAARWAVRETSQVSGPETITVLSVGDSHTFGFPLPPEDSYPAQLEAGLAARHPEHDFRVINLGRPGLNSTFVANRLERQMFQLRPHLVIVWVGINNMWSAPETLSQADADAWRSLREALLDLRLFRLASIAWFSQTGHQYDPEGRGGGFDGERPPSGQFEDGRAIVDPWGRLGPDLEHMIELAHRLDTPIVLVTYPLDGAAAINRTIRQAAGQGGAAVIDTRRALVRAAAAGHRRPELIDERAGPHPTRLLYGYVVEDLLPEVEAALSSWHGLPGAAGPGPPPSASTRGAD
jgi:hypothetical protein